jgi:hypothetical protein
MCIVFGSADYAIVALPLVQTAYSTWYSRTQDLSNVEVSAVPQTADLQLLF